MGDGDLVLLWRFRHRKKSPKLEEVIKESLLQTLETITRLKSGCLDLRQPPIVYVNHPPLKAFKKASLDSFTLKTNS